MSYLLKREVAEDIKAKYKNSYISDKLGLSGSYVSLILHRHRPIPKRLAYSFTKAINEKYEIEDLFENVK